MYSFLSRFPTRTRIFDSTRPILREETGRTANESLFEWRRHFKAETQKTQVCQLADAVLVWDLADQSALTILSGFLLWTHWPSGRCNACSRKQRMRQMWNFPTLQNAADHSHHESNLLKPKSEDTNREKCGPYNIPSTNL